MRNLQGKRLALLAAALVGLLAVAGVSKPGRATLGKIISAAGLGRERHSYGAVADATDDVKETAASQDVEQRARAAHGWQASVTNSIVRGELLRFDPNGTLQQQWAITVYRKYPDRLRVEIQRIGAVDVFGMDNSGAWKAGAASLSEPEARDVRAFLRLFPERLFLNRAGGASYREVGQRFEDRVEVPAQPVFFDQVEAEDLIGPPPAPPRPGDRRMLYYYVDQEASLVSTARWLEPDDPTQLIDDPGVSLTDVRVDFADWRTVSGMKWPFRITHQLGGRVDFRIDMNQVLVNQSMPDTFFQRPN
jgi:hypothetical protein